MLLLLAALWIASAALAGGLLHHATPPARLLSLLGPLALLYLLGVYLSPIDPTPPEAE